jgi:hypothetical protein
MSGRAVRYGAKIYLALLAGYPQRFLDRFRDEMVATFGAAQEEVARRGVLPLLWLWMRELWDWPGCVLRQRLDAWRVKRQENMLAAPAFSQDIARPGGRWSRSEVWPVVLLLAAYGLAMLIGSYVGPHILRVRPLWNLMDALLTLAMLGLPLVGVALAAIRGFPRWAFAYLGSSLGIVMFATMIGSTKFPWLPAAVALALSATLLVPAVRGLLRRVWQDPTLLSLAFYASLPIAVMIAFDDSFANGVTVCMAGVALLYPAAAWPYTTRSHSWERYLVLWLGAMAILFIAVLDLNYFWKGDVFDVVTTVNGLYPGGHILRPDAHPDGAHPRPALLWGPQGAAVAGRLKASTFVPQPDPP